MDLFFMKCESRGTNYPVRIVSAWAENGDEAEKTFWESNVAPFPQMRDKGYIPIATATGSVR